LNQRPLAGYPDSPHSVSRGGHKEEAPWHQRHDDGRRSYALHPWDVSHHERDGGANLLSLIERGASHTEATRIDRDAILGKKAEEQRSGRGIGSHLTRWINLLQLARIRRFDSPGT